VSEVVATGLTKRFGDTLAVDSLDLRVDDGEFMVLLGPSGCGKTTVLRLIAGLERVSEGTLHIGARDVTEVEAKDRDVAMVFQSYALYPHMTVAENIESPLVARRIRVEGEHEPRRLGKAERRQRVTDAARVLGLDHLLHRKPGALSGGQRQRVALARAIVARPSVFLMDEPLSNLDAKLRAQTRLELVELQQRLATTFVYVTHDQVEAMTMATRMAIMHEGRLQQVGSPREVYERPANLFVARFIGSPPMSSLTGRVELLDGEPWVTVGDGAFRAGTVTGGLVSGQPVVVGVRPEHLHLADHGPTATVRAVEWLGHERHLVCDVAGEQVTVREPAGSDDPLVGRAVQLRADPDHVHLFDVQTGERFS
jgi:ABC-type sugar transport system ATPase subunit